MRWLLFPLFATLPAVAAHADPAQDARSATAACLSAVIDGAPVGDIHDGAITIRRGKDPVSCTVSVSDGEPVVVRDAVMTAITRRSELFRPTRTKWDSEAFASREAFCNLSLRRHLNVVVATAKPGGQPVLAATVSEAAARDPRCDQDHGVQTIAGTASPPPAASAIQELSPPLPKAKRRLLPRLPGLGRKTD